MLVNNLGLRVDELRPDMVYTGGACLVMRIGIRIHIMYLPALHKVGVTLNIKFARLKFFKNGRHINFCPCPDRSYYCAIIVQNVAVNGFAMIPVIRVIYIQISVEDGLAE